MRNALVVGGHRAFVLSEKFSGMFAAYGMNVAAHWDMTTRRPPETIPKEIDIVFLMIDMAGHAITDQAQELALKHVPPLPVIRTQRKSAVFHQTMTKLGYHRVDGSEFVDTDDDDATPIPPPFGFTNSVNAAVILLRSNPNLTSAQLSEKIGNKNYGAFAEARRIIRNERIERDNKLSTEMIATTLIQTQADLHTNAREVEMTPETAREDNLHAVDQEDRPDRPDWMPVEMFGMILKIRVMMDNARVSSLTIEQDSLSYRRTTIKMVPTEVIEEDIISLSKSNKS